MYTETTLKMMNRTPYRELQMTMKDRDLSVRQLADSIHLNYQTLCLKLNGESHFTLDEAMDITEVLTGNRNGEELERLFRKEDRV